MNEFKEKYLHEVVDIRVSNVDKKIYPSKSLVKLCNYMDAYSNDYISSKINFSTGSADVNEIQKFGLKIDDVVITKDSETPEDIAVSSVVIEDLKNVVCGYHLAILRPNKDDLDGKYLMFKFKSDELKGYFLSFAKGSTRFGLTIGDIENAKIKFPSLSTQQHIARILSTADAVIEKTQAAIAKYKAIKQGMLQDLFTRGIDMTSTSSATYNKLRPRYEDAPELYKGSKLGWIPREWEVEKLVNLCSEKPTYGINAAAVEFTHQLPTYLRITDIDEDGNFSKTGRKCVDSTFSGNYILRKGDLVFARTGASVGKTYLYNEADGILVFAGFLIKVSPNEKLLVPDFLKFLTETSYYLNWVGLMSQRSAQPGINGNEYGSFLVPKPYLNEQKRISEKLLAVHRKLQTEQTYLQKMQLLKKGLMEDLLSGRKRVKVPDAFDIDQTGN
jgi:type I restriction enzyme, S subunit